MILTPEHIAELVLCRHYSDNFAHSSASKISEVLHVLIHEGLVTVVRQHETTSSIDMVISERGRQALTDVGSVYIIHALHDVDKEHLLQLCNDALTLADLPTLLTSSDERVRALARRIYQKWDQPLPSKMS